MKTPLVPLSSICPTWKQSFVPDAVEVLKLGMEAERARFRGKPFVVLVRRSEFNYDGLRESLEFLEGFPAADEALAHARSCAEAARNTTANEPCYGDRRWRVVDGPRTSQSQDRTETGPVRTIFVERFQMENGSGYDVRYFTYGVLEIQGPDIIDCELFTYLDSEWEITSYLMRRGKEVRR